MHRLALLLCLLLCAPFAAAQPGSELPAAPAGYHWEADGPARMALLCPDGWFVRREDGVGNRAVFISKEEIAPGRQFVTGLSMFHVEAVSTRVGQKPSAYATTILAGLARRNEVLGVLEEQFEDGIVGRSMRVRNVGARTIVVQYYLVTDDDADLFWMLSFEAPEAEWDTAWVHGEHMLKALFWR